jgi:hypothetical protein
MSWLERTAATLAMSLMRSAQAIAEPLKSAKAKAI